MILHVISFDAMPSWQPSPADTFLRQAKEFLEQARSFLDDIPNILDDDEDDDEDDEDEAEKDIPSMNEGEPKGELRFGAGFEIDEPRREDYVSRYDFEDDHAAFDRFVDAGEDCVARGLEKKSDAPITKCNAIKTNVGDMPPMGVDIIGETHWWQTPFAW